MAATAADWLARLLREVVDFSAVQNCGEEQKHLGPCLQHYPPCGRKMLVSLAAKQTQRNPCAAVTAWNPRVARRGWDLLWAICRHSCRRCRLSLSPGCGARRQEMGASVRVAAAPNYRRRATQFYWAESVRSPGAAGRECLRLH